MNDRNVYFVCRLKEICKERGITLEELAERIGVSYRAVQFWCRGHGVKLRYAMMIARELDMSVEDIWEMAECS